MMKLLVSLTLIVFYFSVTVDAQNKTVYTSTTEKACKTLELNEDEGGLYKGECPGVGGYKLHLLEGDIRQTLDVITPKKKTFELDFWNFYGGFSYIGKTVEWRIKRGEPVALIARFYVSNGEERPKDISYLMVSKISESISCVTDIVIPQANQNVIARNLADEAYSKPCRAPHGDAPVKLDGASQ
jgi:hypothetical protein